MDFNSLIAHPEVLLLVLAPLFFVCILAEWYFGDRRGRLPDNARYHLPEVLCNFTLAGLHQGADILTGLLIAKLYLWAFDWRLLDIQMGLGSFIALIIAQDFCYYWFHQIGRAHV